MESEFDNSMDSFYNVVWITNNLIHHHMHRCMGFGNNSLQQEAKNNSAFHITRFSWPILRPLSVQVAALWGWKTRFQPSLFSYASIYHQYWATWSNNNVNELNLDWYKWKQEFWWWGVLVNLPDCSSYRLSFVYSLFPLPSALSVLDF